MHSLNHQTVQIFSKQNGISRMVFGSPIAAIPNKSKAFRSILNQSFTLKLTPHGCVPSVNKNSKKTSPKGAIDQIGHVLLRLIRAFAEAPDCAKIFQAKWDIKDGFGRLDFKEGGE